MSQVFEGYERQYCEFSANLSKKCASASLLEGEQKKQKVSDIKAGLDDAETLIRKMDLEARSLPPNAKAMLLAKLREYKTDLNNLKSEVKRITLAGANQAARDDLLESGMVSADQRGRLLMSTERLNQSSDRIKESRRTMLETEDLGVSILQDLHQQRQSLLHANNTLHGVDDNVGRSKKILTSMSRRMSRNKWIIGSVIAVLIQHFFRIQQQILLKCIVSCPNPQPVGENLDQTAPHDLAFSKENPATQLDECSKFKSILPRDASSNFSTSYTATYRVGQGTGFFGDKAFLLAEELT
ncbi:unnamed protein product [Ilex paraguariensis]|uniref:t-SNARE coiled-coil homology domain-containing protein n=1 Tax=Ilex paraguariensis TaxID=185542 RepID=A0ABC8R5H7_9AQUA